MAQYRLILAAVLSLVSFSSFAADKVVLELKSSAGKTYQFFNKAGSRVSENCLRATCLALAPVKKIKEEKDKSEMAPHPAASFCLSQEGTYEVARYPNGDEDGVCVFKDQSYILGWDYHKKHHKKDQK